VTRYGFIVIPLLFYFITVSRTPGWVDAALALNNAYNLKLSSWVNSHNLFSLIGSLWLRVFPLGNLFFSINILSALFGVGTVQVAYLIGIELTENRVASASGAVILMISHSLWWHSTIVEVYTLNAFFIVLIMLHMVRYLKTKRVINLYYASAFWGLGCSNHVLMGLYLGAFIVLLVWLIIRRESPGPLRILAAVGFFFLGFSLYLVIFFRDAANGYNQLLAADPALGKSLKLFLKSAAGRLQGATGGGFRSYMFPKGLPKTEMKFWRFNYIFLIFYNFPFAVPLAIYGFIQLLRRPELRNFLIFYSVGLVAQIIWSANYLIWDMYAFSMPVYVMLAVPITFGVHRLIEISRKTRIFLACTAPLLLTPFILYPAVPRAQDTSSVVQRYFANYPEVEQVSDTWDPITYVFNPIKTRFNSVEESMAALIETLPGGAHYWTDDSRDDYPLTMYYQEILGKRKDIAVHSLFTPEPFFSKTDIAREARAMERVLTRGESVYFVSLRFPYRQILEQLYFSLDHSKSLKELRGLTVAELVDSFPVYAIEKVPLPSTSGRMRYRFVPR
jgi:hypothetical protein